jgi:hypothetical protein
MNVSDRISMALNALVVIGLAALVALVWLMWKVL